MKPKLAEGWITFPTRWGGTSGPTLLGRFRLAWPVQRCIELGTLFSQGPKTISPQVFGAREVIQVEAAVASRSTYQQVELGPYDCGHTA